jgi:diguanylate cyclase (GGDEF)-like protein
MVGAMLRAACGSGLVLTEAVRLAAATQELLDHGADCVLIDLSLSAADPLGSLEPLLAAAPDTPVIALTAPGEEQLSLSAIRQGAQDCLPAGELSPAILRRALLHAVERKRTAVGLMREALHDPLTGLPNRALFLDRLGVALDRSKRTGARIAVLFLDVDHFKEINDAFGHSAGDQLLSALGERLRGMLRPMDTVARFGGDEFTFLFEELDSEREVVLIAERISRAAAAPVLLEDAEVAVTVSIGIAIIEDPGLQPEAVIREADAAMYRAKERGRARFELFDDLSQQRASSRLALEADLRRALEHSQLRVFYQPKVCLDLDTGLVGFEALLRWEHPERGLIPPGEFLPVAEETGMIAPIGEFVLDQAVGQLARWRRHRPDLTMSVNLSARQLHDTSLVGRLTAKIEARDVDPGALCLEVTERAMAGRPELVGRALQGLKSAGIRLAVDDYGTGPSLLASLGELPFDTIKIHESFVRTIDESSRQASLVAGMIELGHALGCSVVAEGVETDRQLAKLRTLGCDDAQGYLFSPAIPEDEALALLNGR